MPTFYDVLGVSPQSGEQDIKRAYRSLAMQYHPDKNTAPDAGQRFIVIQDAYDFLMNPVLRSRYDERLNAGSADQKSYTANSSFYEPFSTATDRNDNKYRRGRPRNERDLNALFNNFETRLINVLKKILNRSEE